MFPQIRLQSIPARLDMWVDKGSLEIQQKQADLEIEQPKAELTIERRPSQLTIDQTKAREDVGYKSVPRMIEDAAAEGKQAVMEGIARRGQERDELLQIQNGGNPIAAQAKRNSQGSPKQFGIGWIPSPNSVKINYDPGEVNVSIETKKAIINTKMNNPEINYTPSKVNIQLAQYPSLEIDFENLKYIGVNYEQYI
ncbi:MULTISPECIES: DUF6470 family protein [unclassified Bacillus (in: firmicutes)]|uniref:DUF6470 family protein n=1 Tax=unclassified Bacillus (in: firmicutes) TaxID=185979 RepID=UPI0004E213A0|nr:MULTISPECIES: DUF6470 family protein [unclassified Bacillus (in: firmicutes)]